jgi:aspartate/methionine/tyrosine aminotransferase
MSNLLLAIPKLSPDHIDLSVGEAHIVRHALFTTLDLYRSQNALSVDLYSNNKCEYQPPTGYSPLVKFLEDKHQAPVVITNGAKQALGATAYALHKMGKKTIGLHCPWWCLIPPLMQAHGMEAVCDGDMYDAYLAVLPNNPDGQMLDPTQFKYLADWHKELDIPFIHDAVYYNPIYLPTYKDFPAYGDVQIYSMSKFLGLSGLRVGYCVCPNEQFYHLIQEYMEMMTVGVSTVSQSIVLELLTDLEQKPTYDTFIQRCQKGLFENKTIIKSIRKDILDVPENITDIAGMFYFGKVHRPDVFEKAKVNVANGIHFGREGYIRTNLAVRKEVLIEFVERLNNV